MDPIIKLNSINTLNDYTQLTQDLAAKHDVAIAANKATVVALNKVRGFEFEYFNKLNAKGAAFMLIEHLLKFPHRVWGPISTDLIALIRYWLDGVRKYLISHHIHWWSFLKCLLDFIKQMYKKEESLSNTLVRSTSRYLLDFSVNSKTDILQQYEILHTLNLYCRKADMAVFVEEYMSQCQHYFKRLSTILATSAYAPTQIAILETLLRWCKPPIDEETRKGAAEKWFLPHLYSRTAVDTFLDRTWSKHFYEDARDFLNCHNSTNELVVSVVCRELTIGSLVVINGNEPLVQWLDLNIGIGLSLMLGAGQLNHLGLQGAKSLETLAMLKEDINYVKLARDADRVFMSIKMSNSPRIIPSGLALQKGGDLDVFIVISSRSDLARVHMALKNTFLNKYKVSLDINSKLSLSPLRPCDTRKRSDEEDGNRFAHPDKRQSYGHLGVITFSGKRKLICNSPSSASTTSLAQLPDKLKKLPLPPSPKTLKGVINSPKLPMISESGQSDHAQDTSSSLKILPAQVEVKSQSDGEPKGHQSKVKDRYTGCSQKGAQSDPEGYKHTHLRSNFPNVDSTDSRIYKSTEANNKDLNTGNILDLLEQEAFQKKNEQENLRDSGIQDSEVIEDTQYSNSKAKNKTKETLVKRKIISKSTSDESNTEALHDHQKFVTVRKRNLRKKSAKPEENENATFDFQAVEDFFSQNIENVRCDITISPTLAKKINATSSEGSDDCFLADIENNCGVDNVTGPDLHVDECCSTVDKVGTDLGKCAQPAEPKVLKEISNEVEQSKPPKTRKNKPKQTVKLKFNKKQKTPKKAKGKLKLEPVSKMSTIIEDKNESNAYKTLNSSDAEASTEIKRSFMRRKRKLYSPKDDHTNIHCDVYDNIDDDDLIGTEVTPKRKSNTFKSSATCYRDIEQDRQNYRNNRSRKLRNPPLSPKTKQSNEIFDHLKDNIEGQANITVMDKKSAADAAIYNFTSDSEDDDFKQKKIDVQKRASTTTIGSGVSVMSTRRGRTVAKINYKDFNKKSSDEAVTKPVRRKKAPKRKSLKNKVENVKVDPPILLDERMRAAPDDVLNSSFIDKPKDTDRILVPVIERLQLENIPAEDDAIEQHKKPIVKEVKNKPTKEYETDEKTLGSVSISPLPGLVIERDNKKNDRDESVTTNLVNKLKKVHQDFLEDKSPHAQDVTNTTQQMLFDNDVTNSPQINITEEFGRIWDAENELLRSGAESNRSHNDTSSNVIDDTICSYNVTKKSAAGSTKSNRPKRNRLRLKSKESEKLNTKDFKFSSEQTNSKAINCSQKSKPIKSSIEEKPVDEVRVTGSRSKSFSQLREILEVSSSKSVKSIASADINAHGDMDEYPPDMELLNEKISPREVEDLDNTVKKYYIDLMSKFDVSDDSSKDIRKNKNKSDSSSFEKYSLAEKVTKMCDSDIAKYLPSVRDSEEEASLRTSPKKKTPTVCLRQLSASEIARWTSSPSLEESSVKSAVTEQPINPICNPRKKDNRKSQISPINLDDLLSKNLNTSDSKPNTSNTQDAEDKHVDISKPVKRMKPARGASPVFNVSSDLQKLPPKLPVKRNSPVVAAERNETNVKKIRLDGNTCKSSESSTLDDWWKNLDAVSKGTKEHTLNDVLENIIEKLDTTLLEVHRNSRKNIFGVCVEADKKITDMKEQRRADIRQIIKLMEEMDRRAEERENAFKSWIHQSITAILKKEGESLQAMVSILRQDVEACARAARQ